MFGNNDNQQSTVGAPTTQSPSMLDNVSAQDFGDDTSPASPVSDNPATVLTSQPDQNTEPEHPITTDNPFNPTPAVAKSTYTPSPNLASTTPEPVKPLTELVTDEVKSPAISTHSSPSIQPSGPVAPPAPITPTPLAATDDSAKDEDTKETASPAVSTVPSVDTEKLAGMKQQALEHLEPLVGHLDQKPEEEFRTTMMMIQANDNHTLLDKALDAAKKISDSKERAQAMLDIINEINYFSQSKTEE